MEFNELVQRRRSVRAYQENQTVSRETIEEILTSTLMAPTWKNTETGRYYIVNTSEAFEEVKGACLPPFNQKNVAGASALIVTTFVKNISGYEKSGEPTNEFGNQWGAYDLGLQAAYLVLKAKDLGLDTLIMGIRDAEQLRNYFSIPENEEVASVIALGYGVSEPEAPRRKPLERIAQFCS